MSTSFVQVGLKVPAQLLATGRGAHALRVLTSSRRWKASGFSSSSSHGTRSAGAGKEKAAELAKGNTPSGSSSSFHARRRKVSSSSGSSSSGKAAWRRVRPKPVEPYDVPPLVRDPRKGKAPADCSNEASSSGNRFAPLACEISMRDGPSRSSPDDRVVSDRSERSKARGVASPSVTFVQTEVLPDRLPAEARTAAKSLFAERTAEELTRCDVNDLGWDIALPTKLPGSASDALTSARAALKVKDTLATYPDFPGTVTKWVEQSYLRTWEKRMEWELFHWRYGEVKTPASKLASRLRGHFGLRPPTLANALLGEHWLLEQYAHGLEASCTVNLAVKLWATPTIRDDALAQHPSFLVGR
uniref:Putative P1 n=1 Tax=Babaco virus Q TaxID=2760415 RepID=A0A7G4WFR6_9VIRU|nr:hypothetical protein [Babaco virus Q]QQV74106.1 putative P1 [Babaco virus Q]